MYCRPGAILSAAILWLLPGMVHCLAQSPGPSSKAFSGTDRELIGAWAGNGEVIEFRPDGQCLHNGKVMRYVITQNHIAFQMEGSTAHFTYEIRVGKLILTAGGEQAVYSRLTEAPKTAVAQSRQELPEDLAGRWCYVKISDGSHTDRCITLIPDGSYRYTVERNSPEADSGTWYVEGNRLYYQSALRGIGFYVLERRNSPGNPMVPLIVLNDEPFVTVDGHAPWK